jgi:disulfide bond formation protein DsbB
MCIVQRYLYILVLLLALAGWAGKGCRWHAASYLLIVPVAAAGAFVAARQSWLQWYPPEFYSCGRDFYGMIEQMPLSQALPKIFAGSGDCTAVDWTFLGGTIANWSFVGFVALIVIGIGWLLRMRRQCAAK